MNTTKASFVSCNIVLILKYQNVTADSLAKSVRAKDILFFYINRIRLTFLNSTELEIMVQSYKVVLQKPG